MEPIAFLKCVQRENLRISNEFENLKEIEFMIHNVKSVQWEGARHGGGYHSDTSDKLILLERKREALTRRITKHIEMLEKAENIIDCVGEEREKLVLYYRFISGYPWETIARKLKICENQLYRIQAKAFKKIAGF